MNRQEYIYLAQKIGLQASKLSHDTSLYITAPCEQHKFEALKRLTDIIGTCNYMLEQIHRDEFTAQITERVQAVEKRKIDAR